VVRIGHNVGEAIRSTAEEKGASLLLIGWRGDRTVPEMILGATLDSLIENPPCDVAVLKLRGTPPPGKILVPTHGGGHAPLSLRLAGAIARARGATVTVYNVVPPDEEAEMLDASRKARGRALLQQAGAADTDTEIVIEHGNDPVEAIVRKGEGYDLLVVGATTEPAWRNYLFGAKPEQITQRFQGSVLMVKSHLGKRSETMRRLVRSLRRARQLLRPG
jgi:glucosyl-3-phosphoglycerate synthase